MGNRTKNNKETRRPRMGRKAKWGMAVYAALVLAMMLEQLPSLPKTAGEAIR